MNRAFIYIPNHNITMHTMYDMHKTLHNGGDLNPRSYVSEADTMTLVPRHQDIVT
jgi:hypothetical protein